MIKKVLITGSRGYIGTALKTHLQRKGYEVVGTYRSSQFGAPDEILLEPFKKIELGDHKNIDGIIHLAGEYLINGSLEEAEKINASILGLTSSVADLVRGIQVPMIAAGSFFEKSVELEILYDPYVLAKSQARKILERAALISDVNVGVVFLYDNYSSSLKRGKFVDQLLNAAINGDRISASSGNQVLDLTHVFDVCESLEMALLYLANKSLKYVEFQTRSHKSKTLKQIGALVEEIKGKKIVDWGALEDRRNSIYSLWDSAVDIPDFTPKIEFESFVKEFLNERA
jgi:CDP-paratose synthetase